MERLSFLDVRDQTGILQVVALVETVKDIKKKKDMFYKLKGK